MPTTEKHAIDILCISESFLSPQVSENLLPFPGYQIFRRDREGRRGGGVAILLRAECRAQELAMPDGGPLETLWVSVSWSGHRPITVGAIYRPPTSPLGSSLEHLGEQLQAARCLDRPVFLLGDININMLDDGSPQTRNYNAVLDEHGMAQLVRQPTHLHPVPTALDHVITNQLEPAPTVEVTTDTISDHQPVIVRARLGRVRHAAEWRTVRSWRRVNWNVVCHDLLLSDWSLVEAATDVNECVEQFMVIWDTVMDRHCPPRRVRARGSNHPWIADNAALRSLMRERDAARSVWLAQRTPEARAEFVRLRNRVKSSLICARRDYLCSQMTSGRKCDFWKNFKKFATNKYKSPSTPTTSADLATRKADDLNQYFASVGACIADQLRDTRHVSPRPPTVCSTAFELKPVTLPELSRCIRNMNATKACGLDGVPFHAIINCFAVIGPHLLRIVNLSIRLGVFPDRWKTACIVPIPKSGDPDIPSNNRPISLLSTLSKILEKAVCTQLSDYLREHHLLSPSQYAYRPRHSTEDAVLDAVERLVTNTDNGLVSAVTTLDLSKAFDSVDHDLLITKLSWYGITDATWFRSYLSDRHQIVRGGTLTLPVSCGVPQGSILGPILFVLFTCDLPSHLTHGHLISYADDSHHIDSAQPDSLGLSALKERLELTMNELHGWFSANSLKMNETKTNFMLVGTKTNIKKTSGFSLEINGSTLKSSDKLTFLGVVIDSHLSWEAHISQVVKKCNYILVSFYRLRHYFTKDALKLLIEAFAFTHIFYCLCVWGGATKTQLSKIQKLINFSARIVTGVKKKKNMRTSHRYLLH